MTAGPEIEAKRLEILRDALPGISRVAYFVSKRDNEWDSVYGKSVRTAAKVLGLTLLRVEYLPHVYSEAFAFIRRARPDALFVGGAGAPAFVDRALIATFAMQSRFPSSFFYREGAEAGALMSYGVNAAGFCRSATVYVDKVLKGAKPADLPVEQPRKFELVINVRTARSIGVTIPRSVMLRADHVIE